MKTTKTTNFENLKLSLDNGFVGDNILNRKIVSTSNNWMKFQFAETFGNNTVLVKWPDQIEMVLFLGRQGNSSNVGSTRRICLGSHR